MISDLPQNQSERTEPDAIQRAIEYGVDITLLLENLKLAPSERLRKAQAALDSVLAFQTQVKAFRIMQDKTGGYDTN